MLNLIAILLVLITLELLYIVWKMLWNDDRMLGIEMNHQDFGQWLHSDMQELNDNLNTLMGRRANPTKLTRFERLIVWLLKLNSGSK